MPIPALSRDGVAAGIRFEGHAIVSADGMMSDRSGEMPPWMRNDADSRHFQAALSASTVVVLGRLGHRRHPNTGRNRLVFTSTVAALAADADDARAVLFNPAGASLAEALMRFGMLQGTVVVTGGTRVFDAFLPLYDAFDLAEVHGKALPHGRPCFVAGHPRAVLAAAGLCPTSFRLIDPAASVSLTRWTR
jgi:dihydrofolate reductase